MKPRTCSSVMRGVLRGAFGIRRKYAGGEAWARCLGSDRGGSIFAAMSAADVPGEAVHFEAVIVPHRSLSPAGLRWVLGSLLVLGGVISTGLWYLGAWPVIGFTAAGLLLAIWLVCRNVADAKASEMLILSDAGL